MIEERKGKEVLEAWEREKFCCVWSNHVGPTILNMVFFYFILFKNLFIIFIIIFLEKLNVGFNVVFEIFWISFEYDWFLLFSIFFSSKKKKRFKEKKKTQTWDEIKGNRLLKKLKKKKLSLDKGRKKKLKKEKWKRGVNTTLI